MGKKKNKNRSIDQTRHDDVISHDDVVGLAVFSSGGMLADGLQGLSYGENPRSAVEAFENLKRWSHKFGREVVQAPSKPGERDVVPEESAFGVPWDGERR